MAQGEMDMDMAQPSSSDRHHQDSEEGQLPVQESGDQPQTDRCHFQGLLPFGERVPRFCRQSVPVQASPDDNPEPAGNLVAATHGHGQDQLQPGTDQVVNERAGPHTTHTLLKYACAIAVVLATSMVCLLHQNQALKQSKVALEGEVATLRQDNAALKQNHTTFSEISAMLKQNYAATLDLQMNKGMCSSDHSTSSTQSACVSRDDSSCSRCSSVQISPSVPVSPDVVSLNESLTQCLASQTTRLGKVWLYRQQLQASKLAAAVSRSQLSNAMQTAAVWRRQLKLTQHRLFLQELALSKERQSATECSQILRNDFAERDRGTTFCIGRATGLEADNVRLQSRLMYVQERNEELGSAVLSVQQTLLECETSHAGTKSAAKKNRRAAKESRRVAEENHRVTQETMHTSAVDLANAENHLSRMTVWVTSLAARAMIKPLLAELGTRRKAYVEALQKNKFQLPSEERAVLLAPVIEISDSLEAFSATPEHVHITTASDSDVTFPEQTFDQPDSSWPYVSSDTGNNGDETILRLPKLGLDWLLNAFFWAVLSIGLRLGILFMRSPDTFLAQVNPSLLQSLCCDIIWCTTIPIVFWRVMLLPLAVRRLIHLGYTVYSSATT